MQVLRFQNSGAWHVRSDPACQPSLVDVAGRKRHHGGCPTEECELLGMDVFDVVERQPPRLVHSARALNVSRYSFITCRAISIASSCRGSYGVIFTLRSGISVT